MGTKVLSEGDIKAVLERYGLKYNESSRDSSPPTVPKEFISPEEERKAEDWIKSCRLVLGDHNDELAHNCREVFETYAGNEEAREQELGKWAEYFITSLGLNINPENEQSAVDEKQKTALEEKKEIVETKEPEKPAEDVTELKESVDRDEDGIVAEDESFIPPEEDFEHESDSCEESEEKVISEPEVEEVRRCTLCEFRDYAETILPFADKQKQLFEPFSTGLREWATDLLCKLGEEEELEEEEERWLVTKTEVEEAPREVEMVPEESEPPPQETDVEPREKCDAEILNHIFSHHALHTSSLVMECVVPKEVVEYPMVSLPDTAVMALPQLSLEPQALYQAQLYPQVFKIEAKLNDEGEVMGYQDVLTFEDARDPTEPESQDLEKYWELGGEKLGVEAEEDGPLRGGGDPNRTPLAQEDSTRDTFPTHLEPDLTYDPHAELTDKDKEKWKGIEVERERKEGEDYEEEWRMTVVGRVLKEVTGVEEETREEESVVEEEAETKVEAALGRQVPLSSSETPPSSLLRKLGLDSSPRLPKPSTPPDPVQEAPYTVQVRKEVESPEGMDELRRYSVNETWPYVQRTDDLGRIDEVHEMMKECAHDWLTEEEDSEGLLDYVQSLGTHPVRPTSDTSDLLEVLSGDGMEWSVDLERRKRVMEEELGQREVQREQYREVMREKGTEETVESPDEEAEDDDEEGTLFDVESLLELHRDAKETIAKPDDTLPSASHIPSLQLVYSLSNTEPSQIKEEKTEVKEDIQVEEEKKEKDRVVVISGGTGRTTLERTQWAERRDGPKPPTEVASPARKWPFQLDMFQRHALAALEEGKHVFVAAHTSAGKTVVAEYAIAMALAKKARVIYTSPVKALSNQKYSQLKEEFGDVGLITGDFQINDCALCLVMTTEILRSMLYNSSEKIYELEFVIFDEVHYFNDHERGHVWEEVLILLKPSVKIVMLSATVPNAMEFATWVGRTKQRKVVVCTTNKRPVPLDYYISTVTGGSSARNLFPIKKADQDLLRVGYQQAQAVQEEVGSAWGSSGSDQMARLKTMYNALFGVLREKDWMPAVVFAFSRKKCTELAIMLSSNSSLDLTNAKARYHIDKFFMSQVRKLDPVDQTLPQIVEMKKILASGIGVHHSGILPTLKEIVEKLYQDGWIKLLFATETFAVGVNMPARTVIFDSIKKFDGGGMRDLLPAEFIQMAGRAGRRGKDSSGNVIILCPGELIPLANIDTMMNGKPSSLESKFRVTYSMILTTLRTTGLTFKDIMRSSFMQNREESKMPKYRMEMSQVLNELRELQSKAAEVLDPKSLQKIDQFYSDVETYLEIWDATRERILRGKSLAGKVKPGRLVLLTHEEYLLMPAVILQIKGSTFTLLTLAPHPLAHHDINMEGKERGKWLRMWAIVEGLQSGFKTHSCSRDPRGEPRLVTGVPASSITRLLETRLPPKLSDRLDQVIADCEKRSNTRHTFRGKGSSDRTCEIVEVLETCLRQEKWPVIDESDQNERAPITSLETIIAQSSITIKQVENVFRVRVAEREVKAIEEKMSGETGPQFQVFLKRKAVLLNMRYISDKDLIEMKGKMASRVSRFELLVTELLLSNVLRSASAPEVAAIFSCLVFQSANSSPSDLITPCLKQLVNEVNTIIRGINMEERMAGVGDEDNIGCYDYGRMSFGLVKPIYDWASGKTFGEVMMEAEDLQEGLMVRYILQLVETLKEVESASLVMGDPKVPILVRDATSSLRKGIIFAESIYTQTSLTTK